MSTAAFTSPLTYKATPQQADWHMLANSPTECQLLHHIPNYGDAVFSSYASKKINLDFELKMRRKMGATENVSLVSMPSEWQSGDSSRKVANLQFYKQFDGFIDGQMAWGMMTELERGRMPTFSYQDWYDSNRRIEVSLSSVRFHSKLSVFNDCVANLLPYSFEDISFTILHYDGDSIELNKRSQHRLSQIADFIKHSQDIDLVLISTYTESSFSPTINPLELSEERAKVLQHFFSEVGLSENRIQIHGYGKKRPIADNSSPIGKNKNRRVVISLGRG
ncbi:OmpA family protein [Vibrio sp.]|nr:OmpA family protein [Vibrio sp.]